MLVVQPCQQVEGCLIGGGLRMSKITKGWQGAGRLTETELKLRASLLLGRLRGRGRYFRVTGSQSRRIRSTRFAENFLQKQHSPRDCGNERIILWKKPCINPQAEGLYDQKRIARIHYTSPEKPSTNVCPASLNNGDFRPTLQYNGKESYSSGL